MRTLIAVVLACLAGASCKSDSGAEPFDTYQLCFDQLTEFDMRPVVDSIVECCLDHPIDGVQPVCRDTVPDCINYLTANLVQTDASIEEKMQGCEEYVSQMMPAGG